MDLNRIIKGLSSSGAVSGFAGGLAGSALVGAISGKKGKKVAKNAVKVGALAAVGGLAYTAYKRYQVGNAKPESSSPWQNITQQRFEAVAENPEGSGSVLLLRAMIAAAASDGHMDDAEQNRVFEEAGKLSLSPEEKAGLFDELRNPLSLKQLVAEVRDPETAVEVYAASLIAIDEDRPEGQAYLRALAMALELPGDLVDSIHEQVNAAQQEAVAA